MRGLEPVSTGLSLRPGSEHTYMPLNNEALVAVATAIYLEQALTTELTFVNPASTRGPSFLTSSADILRRRIAASFHVPLTTPLRPTKPSKKVKMLSARLSWFV